MKKTLTHTKTTLPAKLFISGLVILLTLTFAVSAFSFAETATSSDGLDGRFSTGDSTQLTDGTQAQSDNNTLNNQGANSLDSQAASTSDDPTLTTDSNGTQSSSYPQNSSVGQVVDNGNTSPTGLAESNDVSNNALSDSGTTPTASTSATGSTNSSNYMATINKILSAFSLVMAAMMGMMMMAAITASFGKSGTKRNSTLNSDTSPTNNTPTTSIDGQTTPTTPISTNTNRVRLTPAINLSIVKNKLGTNINSKGKVQGKETLYSRNTDGTTNMVTAVKFLINPNTGRLNILNSTVTSLPAPKSSNSIATTTYNNPKTTYTIDQNGYIRKLYKNSNGQNVLSRPFAIDASTNSLVQLTSATKDFTTTYPNRVAVVNVPSNMSIYFEKSADGTLNKITVSKTRVSA